MIKRNFLTTLILALCCMCWTALEAQTTTTTTEVIDAKVQETHAKFLGKTKPLRDLVPIGTTVPVKKAGKKKNKKREVANFIGRDKRDHMNSANKSSGLDPVRQKDFGNGNNLNPIFLLEPIVNMEGINAGGSPSDPTIDVGVDFVIQAVNVTTFQIFDKMGNAVSNPIGMNTLWADLGFSSGGDPIILFDQEVNRWILTEFPSGNQLLMAVSETSDPTGSWMAYNFATPSFPDYPKYAVWNNSYVVTTNEQGNTILPSYFINRQDMLDGVASPRMQRIEMPGIAGGPGFFVSTPVDWSGLNPPTGDPMILRLNDDAWSGNSTDQISIFSTLIDWDDSNNTVVTETNVVTADYDTDACAAPGFGFSCIPQMNGGGIDGLPQMIMNQPHYRNFGSHESMIFNFLVNANEPSDIIAGIRWMEFCRVAGGPWEVYQEGTFSPDDGVHRFNAAMAMDGSGNIGMAYNVSGPNDFPGLRYTGRRSSDPLGEMTVTEFNLVTGGSANGFARWGDYAHMSIDPINDKTFWFTSEYRNNNSTRTRIVAFEFERDSIDIGVSALITPVSSPDLTATETVQIEVKNFGLDTQMVNNVGFIFENGTEVIEAANVMLLPDSTFNYTFTSATVDMSVIGDYHFKLFTTLATDQLVSNDTLRRTVSKVTRNDAGITGVTGLEFDCNDDVPVQFQLTNFGFDNLTSANILVTINGGVATDIPWTGDLATGETADVAVTLNEFSGGTNMVVATSSNPNSQVDEEMSNDSFSRDFEFIEADNRIDVTFTLNFDQFSDETTWELLDANNNVVESGGPYPRPQFQFTTLTETWCLDTSACYTFTINDAYGDGICCGFGEGSYSITLDNGAVLAMGDGEFGMGETINFCPIPVCALTADIEISPETSAGENDGTIMIIAMNGIGPFNYSIDGGMTFQTSNVFNNLGGGDYQIVIQDIAECVFEQMASVPTCTLEITAQVMNETGNSDGSIIVDASNGQGTVTYSIDGGQTFATINTFNGLSMGDYTILARDEAGCEASLAVMIDVEVSTTQIIFGTSIEIMPNPTDGVFRINVKGLDRSDVILPIQIFDMSGKLVQSTVLGKYDDTYTSEVSLTAYPSGTYLIRFLDENINRLGKIIRN